MKKQTVNIVDGRRFSTIAEYLEQHIKTKAPEYEMKHDSDAFVPDVESIHDELLPGQRIRVSRRKKIFAATILCNK